MLLRGGPKAIVVRSMEFLRWAMPRVHALWESWVAKCLKKQAI